MKRFAYAAAALISAAAALPATAAETGRGEPTTQPPGNTWQPKPIYGVDPSKNYRLRAQGFLLTPYTLSGPARTYAHVLVLDENGRPVTNLTPSYVEGPDSPFRVQYVTSSGFRCEPLGNDGGTHNESGVTPGLYRISARITREDGQGHCSLGNGHAIMLYVSLLDDKGKAIAADTIRLVAYD
ncbi:hypothetical protein PUV54_12795 [Hyphococcus flavus]|uniref:Uncharacterized protein n=1 Tax=Hyphococcus flavus TaxID=1866326 RepID=A0AAE9ZD93_9PROT|nr:hypothetical protein [Hyphococcus flavus]WDI30832.1 hypothetical protein PUV54_12795 [Hyphococcus flavus]